jgi:hypothetical protein
MSRSIKIVGLCVAAVIIIGLVFLFVVGSLGPDTAVYTGHQIPKKFMATIRSLNLLSDGEQIRYFYSDAMLDIKAGFYFVSNTRLVLYSSKWETPEVILPFEEIESVEADYSDSFWEDSIVYVTTSSGMDVCFPVSSERGLDRKFVEAIKQNLTAERVTPEAAVEAP